MASAAAQRPFVVPRLYTIADHDALAGRALPAAVASMALAGVRWIQVRAKRLPGRLLYEQLAECCRAVAGSGVTLWVDDRPDLAALLPLGGVHLGQHDLPAAAARPLLPAATLLGGSSHDLEQLAALAADPAVDIAAVGPVFPTASKGDPHPAVGLAMVTAARSLTDKPLVAIGGIDEDNLAAVLAAGADAVAVLAAACRGDVGERCRCLLAAAEAA